MIRSFRHKGLKAYFESGSVRGINAAHQKRLARMLAFIDRAAGRDDLDIPGWKLHKLYGSYDGFWSISVSGNWRVIFRFVESDVELVDYLDYY